MKVFCAPMNPQRFGNDKEMIAKLGERLGCLGTVTPRLFLLAIDSSPLAFPESLGFPCFRIMTARVARFASLSALLLICAGARAADPLQRYQGSPRDVNTTLGFENIEQRNPVRLVNGQQVDLRPLFAWINRGKVPRGRKTFDQPCPLPDWRPLDGTIIKVMDDAVLMARGISRQPVIVRNYPKNLLPVEGGPAAVLAVEAGAFEFESKSGAKEKVPVYDYGIPVSPAPTPTTNSVVKPAFINPPPAKAATERMKKRNE